MNELKNCFPDGGGPCTVEQYFRMLYDKPHSPSWALLPTSPDKSRTIESVSVSRQPLVANKLDRWSAGGSEEMYNKKYSSQSDKQKTNGNFRSELKTLFDAIELSWYSKVCSLVTSPGLQINGVNQDGMTPLDVALLLGDTPIARVLQHHGAVESNAYNKEAGMRYQHVLSLLQETDMKRGVISNPRCASPLPLDNVDSKKDETERRLWKYHSMLSTLKNTNLPKAPTRVKISVRSTSSIKIECYEPTESKSSLITQYRIQWSNCPNLKSGVRTEIVSAGHHLSYTINGLNKGTCYYITIQAGNIKGFGTSSPVLSCVPSHWSDSYSYPDYLSNLSICSNILSELRSQFTSFFPALFSQTPTKYKARNKSLSRMFNVPKYVKTLNRSLYLSVMHCTEHGKVLVTDSDKLPTVEVDDLVTAPSAESELLWLFKLGVSGWPAIRDLRDELIPYQDVGGIGLRYKMLSAVIYLQECLGCTNIGIPYYRLVRKNGQMIILLIKTVEAELLNSPFSTVHFKPICDISTPVMHPKDAHDVVNINMSDLQHLYTRYEQSTPPGLFVGLLMFKVKGEELEIVVDKSSPLLPPLEYVREVNHVTEEEWRAIRGVGAAHHGVLCKQVSAAACTLLSRLEDTVADIDNYSIYTKNIIEVENTSVILIIPPQVVAPLGHDHDINNTISVPLQQFEILHNREKYPELTNTALHASAHLNTCLVIVTQMIRQSLNSEQMDDLKSSQDKIRILAEEIGEIWNNFCQFSGVLSECMKEEDSSVRPISELLLHPSPGSICTSSATSISDTLNSGSMEYPLIRQSGVIRIYSSSDIHITSPCIKLHITCTTSTRDVINSVIRKLRRHDGILPANDKELSELCLVACVNNLTHQIPDQTQILQLGQPWTTAKFYIKFKS